MRIAEYFSTPVPLFVSLIVLGKSEQWKMTGNEYNVGFLATESGVKQFQPCLGGCFNLEGPPHNTGENPPYGMNSTVSVITRPSQAENVLTLRKISFSRAYRE
jgi:hypothetical protein